MPTHHDGNGSARRSLADENAKLKKINQVLMTRVERSMDMQGSDFTLFEHAILLESKVRERTEELERVLSDLRKSHQELARAKAEAERANSSKTRFLAAASHDLLQPLNAARLFVAALAERDQTHQNRGLIDNIDTAFASVEDLLTDLLEISKLDAGVQRVELTDLPLRPLLKALQAEFRPMTDEKGLAFTCCTPDVVLRTDRQLFGRVLRNLIGNAIRYTDRGEVKVKVDAEAKDETCRISVIDSGCGIPGDQQSEIFEEFKRLDPDESRADRGFGLGLAIVQRIVRLLGHPMDLSSTVGKGSRFSLTVPLAEPCQAADATNLQTVVDPSAADHAGMILVIENDQAIRAGMIALLESWGYLVKTASTPEAALADIKEGGLIPDLLIADYHLDQGQLGIDAVAKVRASCWADLPAMIITADRSADVQGAIEGRGLSFLTKPIKPAKLRALMRHLISA